MLKISEAIVVEGRYDKNTLLQIVDATVIETGGFAIFNDEKKRELLKRLAHKRGLIVFTDPDGAGLVIRNHIKGFIEPEYLKHAYIPEIPGKERRKDKRSKEGILGVEGVTPELIINALLQAGATVGNVSDKSSEKISKTDFYRLKLTGAPGSEQRRNELKSKLGFPQNMSTDALMQAINALYDREEFLRFAENMSNEKESSNI